MKKFNSMLDNAKKKEFPTLVDKMPGEVKEVFLKYLAWRNAPISTLDYNLAKDFLKRIEEKSAGINTGSELCKCLERAMNEHTVIGTFRRRFDGFWWKIVPKNRESERVRAQKFAELQETLRHRREAGQTYPAPSGTALRYGYAHRKPGHA